MIKIIIIALFAGALVLVRYAFLVKITLSNSAPIAKPIRTGNSV